MERTAYPRFPEVLAPRELQAGYTPLPDELEWARRSTCGERPRLGLPALLKVFQQLHYFPILGDIPDAIVNHVRAAADIGEPLDSATTPHLRPRCFVITRRCAPIWRCSRTTAPTRMQSRREPRIPHR
nr:DUF4158 domain-containing protein [Burkholderia cenocepacia]